MFNEDIKPGHSRRTQSVAASPQDILSNLKGMFFQGNGDYNSWPLQTGEISDVNAELHTCIVSCNGKEIKEVSWSSPWFACGSGAGTYFMPEKGAKVLLGKFIDHKWYILGFIPYNSRSEAYESVNGRKPLQYGDFVLSTAAGNFIEVRRYGESIQIHNNPNCYMALESTENKMTVRVENFALSTDSGTMNMQSDDKGRTLTSLFLKRKVDDNNKFVKLDIGTTGFKNSSLYSSGGDQETEVIFSLNIGSNARLTVDVDGNVKLYGKSLTFMAETSITTECNGTITDSAVDDIVHSKMSSKSLNKGTV